MGPRLKIRSLGQNAPFRPLTEPRRKRSKPSSAEPAKSTTNKTRVFQVYRDSCIECHDGDGRGESNRDIYRNIPDFTNPAWQSSRSDGELSHSILEGKGKSMPAMKDKVGSVGVMQVVALVREFRGGKLVIEDEEDSTARFRADDHHSDRLSFEPPGSRCPGHPQDRTEPTTRGTFCSNNSA